MLEILKTHILHGNFIINLVSHMLLLFTLLSGLFIYYIGPNVLTIYNDTISNNINSGLKPKIDKVKLYIDDFIKDKADSSSKSSNGEPKSELNNKISLFIDITKNYSDDIYNQLLNKYSKPYRITDKNNSALFNNLKITNIILWITFCVIIAVYKSCHPEINIMEIFINNLFIFICVGIIEFLFFSQVIMNYVPITTTYISTNIFDLFKNKIKNL